MFKMSTLHSAEFEDDPDLYVLKPIKYVGIEVWQVGKIINLGDLVAFSSLC